MKTDVVDWRGGTVALWDLDFLDPARPLAEQLDDLKEDLAQIVYPGGVVLDIGWRPSFSADGRFIVLVVKGSDWDAPLSRDEHTSVDSLMSGLQRAVETASRSKSE